MSAGSLCGTRAKCHTTARGNGWGLPGDAFNNNARGSWCVDLDFEASGGIESGGGGGSDERGRGNSGGGGNGDESEDESSEEESGDELEDDEDEEEGGDECSCDGGDV